MPFPVALAVGLGALSLLFASRGMGAPAEKKGGKVAPPGKQVPITPGGPQLPDSAAELPPEYQAQMAECLRGLNVDGQGVIHPPITEVAIQRCTATAGVFDAAGYPNAAESLRHYARLAAGLLPPIEQKITTPAIPEDLRVKLNQAIALERDPKKLRQWAATLRALPRASEPEVQVQIQWLEATAMAIEAEQATAEALQKVDQVVTGPRYTTMPVPNDPGPTPPTPGYGIPEAPKIPVPKTKAEQAAEGLVLHLWQLQSQYQNPKAVKLSGKLDTTLVKRFQTAAKITADGKPGPGSYLAMAAHGQGRLPLVLYWPKGATKATVEKYQDGLEVLAEKAEERGDAGLALEIRSTASREKGQGGVA